MKAAANISLYEMAKRFRSESLSLHDFQSWLGASTSSEVSAISPGVLLRLKSGGVERVMLAVAKILPACAICEGISEERVFQDLAEHRQCSDRLGSVLALEKMVRIPRPEWVTDEITFQYGIDGYYQCLSCDTRWMLIEPERGRYGEWLRIS